jgi:hypothetical protein
VEIVKTGVVVRVGALVGEGVHVGDLTGFLPGVDVAVSSGSKEVGVSVILAVAVHGTAVGEGGGGAMAM